ncbi:MAG: hypothetical protein Q7R95_10635 [bacterium]|nr:hypothetical protein [bacterium]
MNKICKTCGTSELHWQEYKDIQLSRHPNVWRLYDKDGKIHSCNHKAQSNIKRKR